MKISKFNKSSITVIRYETLQHNEKCIYESVIRKQFKQLTIHGELYRKRAQHEQTLMNEDRVSSRVGANRNLFLAFNLSRWIDRYTYLDGEEEHNEWTEPEDNVPASSYEGM